MLEIPESQTLAKQVNETLSGKKIVKVTANASPHGFAFYTGDPAAYPRRLTGLTLGEAGALSGLVEVKAGDMRLLFGDGANLRYYPAGAALPEKHQLFLGFNDGSALVCTVQMYGGLWAFRAGENDSPYYQVAGLRPSPLTDAFDEAYFLKLFEGQDPAAPGPVFAPGPLKASLSVKGLLATEQRIPGLGNGTLQDILFNAGIHPKTKALSLGTPERRRLFKAVKKTLSEMTKKGGRDTEKDLFGSSGGYRTILSAKTLKDPCPSCGGVIQRQAFLGGNVYFCPSCQPLEK